MSIRIMLTSLITFALLIFASAYVTNKGYERVMPQIEKHKKVIEENQSRAKKLMIKETQELGADPEIYRQTMDKPAPDESDKSFYQRSFKPDGTYLGVLKGAVTKIALAKFQRDRYWIMIKDPVSGDTKEKGKFDFQITELYFQPDDERDYFAEYEQLSPNSFKLYGAAGQYIFEKTNNVQLDF